MNALFVLDDGVYRVFLYPRKALGSPRYQGDGINDRPGAVELSGVMVTSNEAWFRNGEQEGAVTEILDDVSATMPSVRRLFYLALLVKLFV